jgi:hypothetical protein
MEKEQWFGAGLCHVDRYLERGVERIRDGCLQGPRCLSAALPAVRLAIGGREQGPRRVGVRAERCQLSNGGGVNSSSLATNEALNRLGWSLGKAMERFGRGKCRIRETRDMSQTNQRMGLGEMRVRDTHMSESW